MKGLRRLIARLVFAVILLGLPACGVSQPTGSLGATSSPSAGPEADSVDPLSAELLRQYGLQAAGPTQLSTITIGRPTEPPWDLLLEASRKIGLDFAPLAGTNVRMRTTPVVGNLGPWHECVGCSKGGRVHVLVARGQMVGAWLSDDVTVPGVYALSDVDFWCGDDEC